MITYDIKKVYVDAGAILICDEKFYQKYDYKFDESSSHKIELPNGMYKCHWYIDREIYGDGYLKVESGVVIISDPCYCVDRKRGAWDRVLDDMDFLQYEPDGTVLLNTMGGDGCYNVKIKMYKIERVV